MTVVTSHPRSLKGGYQTIMNKKTIIEIKKFVACGKKGVYVNKSLFNAGQMYMNLHTPNKDNPPETTTRRSTKNYKSTTSNGVQRHDPSDKFTTTYKNK